MFHCERCGSSFNASIAASAATCPRCKLRDGKDEPLYFRLFEPSALRVSGLDPRRRGAPQAPPRRERDTASAASP
ncbi:MAG: hypothetical protein U0R71_09520 [Solirubrobacterales bacterium]